ncbi:membrane fusion protein, cobalt-zinc-cadmium efflux system [Dyella sp. OK004]|uniref:efflux RND transporter periplasmic adaptor subunit n=1 Tax=Dyella sp. OK004 TaxID=1855292 RepID=UPI0008E3CF52|nr:efflux RND transporter periplasmic adaptor subunit [Dyella sp. OK004]SFR92909.1 membrane fusion protein, cobalt-zinc-cadmium efflux system [Dyella sp. OK004]
MLFRSKNHPARPIFALALSVLLSACGHGDKHQEAAPAVVDDHGVLRVPEKSPLRARLKIQPVEQRDLAHPLSAPAMVEADPAHTVNILPPVTGRIAELKVGLGDRVTRGQVLAVIASGDYAQAMSDRQKASDALALAKKTLDRAEGVKQAGGAAQKDLETARSAFVQAQAEYDRADTRLTSLGALALGKGTAHCMVVVAPTDGSITALSAAAGAFANDPNAPLMTITNLDHIWVTANVAENEARQIAPGQQADVVLPAWPGRSFHGTVQSVSDVLDADSRRVKARIVMPNVDGALKTNMFATATFQVPQPKVLLVPQSALLMNNDSVTVFVEISPWAFQRRTVELGQDEGGETRITKGLQPGDRVVAAGGVLIND